MKKDLLIVPIIIFLIITFFFSYKFIEKIDYKTALSNKVKYKLSEKDTEVAKIIYNKKEYLITKEEDKLRVLLQYDNEYYLLRKISYCLCEDIGIKDNEIYLHCLGGEGNIEKYTLNNLNVEHERILLNYDRIPNISTDHIKVNEVDYKYIYVSSLPIGTTYTPTLAKCSFVTKECERYK